MSDEKTPAARVACVSLLTHESYVVGARVLGYSLQQSGWRGETLMLVTGAVSSSARASLAPFWTRVKEIEPIENPIARADLKRPEFETTYTKLRAWEQDEYSKIVFLDADILVLGDLNDLLEYTQGSALAAAPCMSIVDEFNSGVMVLEPSQEIFRDMISKTQTVPSHDSSDQGFLNAYFPDWYQSPPSSRLPMKYNVPQFAYMAGNWNFLRRDMRVLHFAGPKPWRSRSARQRGLARRIVQRLTPAPREGPSPFEMWWQARAALDSAR